LADLSSLGDLVISVGADLSPLEQTLNQVPTLAATAATSLNTAADTALSSWEQVNTQIEGVSAGLANLGAAVDLSAVEQSFAGLDGAAANAAEGLQETADAAQAVGDVDTSGVDELDTSLQAVDGSAGSAADSLEQMAPAMHETAEASGEGESSLSEFIATALELGGVVLTLEALKEAVVGSVEAFGEFQRAGEALSAITGDAQAASEALEKLPALADAIGQSIPSLEAAQQKFALYGVSLEQIPPLLESIANASVASGQSFDTVAAAFERMDNTGVLMARSLQQTGLSFSDIANAMGMTDASSKDVIAAFKALGDGADGAAARAQVLSDATQRLGPIARQTADDVQGSWTQLGNAVHEAAVNIGDSIAMIGGGEGLELIKDAIKGVETFIVSMIGYVQQAVDVLTGLYHVALDVVTGIAQALKDAATGDFSKAWDDLKQNVSLVGSDVHDTIAKMGDDWTANGQIIDKIWANNAASSHNSLSQTAKDAADTAQTVTDLGNAAKTAGDAIGAATQPTMAQLTKGMSDAQIAAHALGIELLEGTKPGADALASGMEILKGGADDAGQSFAGLGTQTVNYSTAMKEGIYQTNQEITALQQLASAAPGAAAGMQQVASAVSQVASAAQQASGSVQSLGQQLDQTMNAPIGGGKGGGLSISLKPGDMYTDRTYSPFPLGAPFSTSVFGGNPLGSAAPPGTSWTMFDPGDYAKQLQQQIQQQNQASQQTTQAASALTTASTNLSSMAAAIQDAEKANALEEAAAKALGTASYAQLKAMADAAVQASTDEMDKLQGLSSTLSTTTTALQTQVTATNTATSAMSDLGVMGTQLTAVFASASVAASSLATSAASAAAAVAPAGAIGTMGTPQFFAPSVPSYGKTGPGETGGAGGSEMTTEPWLYGEGGYTPQPMQLSVDLRNANIVGQNAMQNLSDAMANALVSQLASMGIRLTRQ